MGAFNKILYKTLCTILVFGCCTGLVYAQNEEFTKGPKIEDYFLDASESATLIRILCPDGYYVSRCGSAVSLGTSWLKGMQEETTSGITVTTPDYYSYNTPASDIIHIINLRNFFAAKEPFTYTDTNGNKHTVGPETYRDDKNKMLSYVCTDGAGILTGIECEKCPGDGFVAASTVEQNPKDNKLLWKTWNVHTIADCYKEEFSDNTGTYKYEPNNVVIEDSSAVPCYYSVNVPGNNLR